VTLYSPDDLLPLSGLQHLQFCERQWGLIHIEQQWDENRLTAEGRVLHERVHAGGSESRPGVVISRGIYIQSLRLGLAGQADVVEFQEVAPGSPHSIELPGRPCCWRPFPVEYKRGKPKPDSCDEVQLCAQAICLEEMFGVTIPGGALFYGSGRRRTGVPFDATLRSRTEALAERMHLLYSAGNTPAAKYQKKCDRCSLFDRCLPRTVSQRVSVHRYLARALKDEDSNL
jgi:CRISPR-associated exonuclease Cas4